MTGSFSPRVVIVIPARYGSTRLPGKPLADIHGKPMIQWVYERASKVRGVSRCIVATDDQRVFEAVQRFGGDVMMTPESCASGTDRVAAVADHVDGEIFVNVQGDEPLIEPASIETAIALVRDRNYPMATVMTPLKDAHELQDPSVVKVIADQKDRAIYFSRLPIPYSRGPLPEPGEPFVCMRHVGLYVYRRDTLMRFRSLAPAALEKAEVLEQLRALADGIEIGIREVPFRAIGVDTPEDLDLVRKLLV